MTCCHKLEKVVITFTSTQLYETQENPYLAAIKVIDPDIIKFNEVFEEDTS
jgi:hypothetical protein